MGWEIDTEGIISFPRRMALDYAPGPSLCVTENGIANADMVKAAGEVHDPERDAYFEGYIAALASLIDEDISLKGYFPWSLFDNYEWAFGYSKRFGIVHVDYDSMVRTPKQSWHAWRAALEAG